MPTRPTARRKTSDRSHSQATTPRARKHDEAPPNSPATDGQNPVPFQLTIETEPSTPARVTRSMSGMLASTRSMGSMPLITPVSHAHFPPQSHSSPFWLQLSPLDANHSGVLRESAVNVAARTFSHTTLTTPAAGFRSMRPPSTPLGLMSPPTSEHTPFTALSDSAHSTTTALSTPRHHRSPQKFTFQSRSRAHLRTPDSNESQTGSTASSHSTKRPSYVQRLDFSSAVDEDSETTSHLTASEASNGSASEESESKSPTQRGKVSGSSNDMHQSSSSQFLFGSDLASPHFSTSPLPSSSPFGQPSDASHELSISTSNQSLNRPSSPSLFSPTGGTSSTFPPSPSPRPPGMLGNSHWLSPSPMHSTNTGGGPFFLTIPSSTSYALPSPSNPALPSPLSNFTPSSFSSSTSSSSAHQQDSPRVVSNSSSPSVSSTDSSSPDRSDHPVNSDQNQAVVNAFRAVQSLASHPHAQFAHAHMLNNPLFQQQFLQEAANSQPPVSSSSSSKHCNCKKSKCLKLYCECFARGEVCRGCNCVGCENTAKEEDQPKREKAAQQVMERDKNAFHRKQAVGGQAEQNPVARDMRPPNPIMKMIFRAIANQQIPPSLPLMQQIANTQRAAMTTPPVPQLPPKGCGCKKSECQKKYCECFQAGVRCTDACKCVSCRNGKHNDHSRHPEPDISIDLMMPSVPEHEPLTIGSAPNSATQQRQRPVKARPARTVSSPGASPGKRSATMYESSQSSDEHSKKMKSDDAVPVT